MTLKVQILVLDAAIQDLIPDPGAFAARLSPFSLHQLNDLMQSARFA